MAAGDQFQWLELSQNWQKQCDWVGLTESLFGVFSASTTNWFPYEASAFVFFSAHLQRKNACRLKPGQRRYPAQR